jgi:hypothetical protein
MVKKMESGFAFSYAGQGWKRKNGMLEYWKNGVLE